VSLYRKISPNLARKAKQLKWNCWFAFERDLTMKSLVNRGIDRTSRVFVWCTTLLSEHQPSIDRASREVALVEHVSIDHWPRLLESYFQPHPVGSFKRAWDLFRTQISSLFFFSWIQIKFYLHQTLSSRIRDGTQTGLMVDGLKL
jgi:hypothetical protein